MFKGITKIKLATGVDKNGKDWYAVEVSVSDFTTERQFIDKIHYTYLQNLIATEQKNSLDVSVNKH